MKPVIIAGAGISGLTAAINLAKNGYKVEVHEKLSDVGKKHNLNFEGLENWTHDLMKTLGEIGIESDFRKSAVNEVTWYSPSFRKAVLKSKKPFFYLVERGGKNSIEYSLKEQAIEAGVKIKLKSLASRPDIISTGASKPMAFGFGTTYDNVRHEDCVIGILSESISPKGYFYILLWNGHATVCTTSYGCSKGNLRVLHERNLKMKICKEILNGSNKKGDFSGFVNFSVPSSAEVNGRLFTGEAAGFQDKLLGFGMKYALLSGYLAAHSILEGKSYDNMWKESFENEMKSTSAMRYVLNSLGNSGYERLIESLASERNQMKILKEAYCNYGWKRNFIYRLQNFREKYG
jgi:flavin-dependent dehydrogenase